MTKQKKVLPNQTFETFRTQMLTTEHLVIGKIYLAHEGLQDS
jgi:hypothetical protein